MFHPVLCQSFTANGWTKKQKNSESIGLICE